MTQAEFDRRLAKLTATAVESGLCGGCITLSLLATVTAVIEDTDGDILKAHGVGAMIQPITRSTPSSDKTHH